LVEAEAILAGASASLLQRQRLFTIRNRLIWTVAGTIQLTACTWSITDPALAQCIVPSIADCDAQHNAPVIECPGHR